MPVIKGTDSKLLQIMAQSRWSMPTIHNVPCKKHIKEEFI